jgi:uncharacterized membrane protein
VLLARRGRDPTLSGSIPDAGPGPAGSKRRRTGDRPLIASPSAPVPAPAQLTTPGLLLGIGLGGFVDGIVLHQILQWHHMLTSEGSHPATTVAGLEANTLADGLFHAAAWLAVAAGIWALWRATRGGHTWSLRRLVGLMLAGWGAFNLGEGLVDHHLLGLHHVRAGPSETAYDLAFLALGALLVAAGLALARTAERRERTTPRSAMSAVGRTP